MEATPVLVVGAGPVGLMTALLLAGQGVASLVVERRAEPSASPKAHALNPRSLEICAAVGLGLDAIRHEAAPAQEAGTVRFVTRLLGEELGALPYERTDEAVLALTPCPLVNIPQPAFEALLSARAAAHPLITLRRGQAWLSDNGAMSRIRDTASGRDHAVRRDFLVACDGASSPVREALGVAMEGAGRIASNVNIQFEADLGERLKGRPAILYWILDPAAAGTVIAYRLGRTMVFAHTYDPATDPADSFTPERCGRLVSAAIGDPSVAVRVVGASHWTMTSQVAARYRVGRAFLAGDAAHRFPPAGGLGLNTGIADAHNLAWKIAAVRGGLGGEALLDSYEAERRPVALANAEQSLANARRIGRLMRTAAQNWRPGGGLPLGLDLSGQIEAQREHFDSLALQLGYWYDAEGGHAPAGVSDFVPHMAPGHRLPHAWIMRDGRRASSLDLVSPCRFTLIAGADAEAWRKAAEGSPVAMAAAGEDFADPEGDWARAGGPQGAGAALVRPDGHIACLFDDSADAAMRLKAALDAVLRA